MRALLLVVLAACGGSGSGGDDVVEIDAANAGGAACDDFRNDQTYLSIVPPPGVSSDVVIALGDVDWFRYVSPIDPEAPPVPGFIGGLIDGGAARESGPVVEVGPETFRVRGVDWNGQRGKAVVLDPAEDDRCQWVTAL